MPSRLPVLELSYGARRIVEGLSLMLSACPFLRGNKVCQKCVDAIEQHFPGLSPQQQGDFLMGATGFPFVSPEAVVRQIEEMAPLAKGNWRACFGIMDSWVTEDMQQMECERICCA